MPKTITAMLLLSSLNVLASSIPIKDNTDIALTLSQGNYNRIVVKNDKIAELVFPPGTMGIKRDKQDRSIYVIVASPTPFTLFISTEAGHHFSATVNTEGSLGKTVELVPQSIAIAKTDNTTKQNQPKNNPVVPDAILALLAHMEERKPFADVIVKHQNVQAQLWSEGLKVRPKELWDGKLLKGEIIELYNGGKKPLHLVQEWFAVEGALAIKFSKSSLAPKESAILYRVRDVAHG